MAQVAEGETGKSDFDVTVRQEGLTGQLALQWMNRSDTSIPAW